MKRKLLFLVSLLSTSMVLTACGGLGEGGEGGEGGNGIALDGTAEEAANKFYQFASSTGFEITYKTYDDESAQPESNTVGFKNDTFWVKESVAYKKNGNAIEMYEYDAEKGTYEFQVATNETAQMSVDAMLKSFTSVFYTGYDYASQPVGSFTEKQNVTFLGRAATEYTFTYAALDAKATLKIVFDNATGITLKIYGSASASDGSSSAEYEVTSFVMGDSVRVPALNKPSGQGGEGGEGGEGGQGGEGGGGQQDVDYFTNKLLIYVSNQNASLYANSQLALFEDGKFELSFQESNFLVVKLGEYSVGANKTLATLNVKKVYKDRSQEYSSMNETLSLSYADGGYALQVSTSGKVNYIASGQSPVHADIPEEGGQTGDDAKYKVTETQWNAIVVNRGIVSLTSNLTVATSDTTGQTKYEFDNGKIHYLFESSTYTTEMYYEFTSENSGYVYYKSNGVWSKQAAPGDFHALFDGYVGILQVPYNRVSFNSSSHYYSCNSWSVVDSGGNHDSYENTRFYFEQGNLIKTSYQHWNIDYIYNYTAYGQTSVTLPQTGGQTDSNARYKITSSIWEDMITDAGLVDLESNFTGAVRSSDMEGQSKYEFDSGKIHSVANDGYESFAEFTSLSGGYTYYKDESGIWNKRENTFGIASYMNSLGLQPLGNVAFSQLTFNESTHEYQLSSASDIYGSVVASNIAISFVDNKLMKVSYTKDGIYHESEFAKYGQTSVTLPEVGGGGQQQQSKWPAEDIANKLAALGFNVTVPAPSVDEQYIDSVTDAVSADNTSLLITITLTDATYSAVVFSSFVSGFQDEFTLDYMSSDIENGIYVFVNEAKDTVLTMTYSRTSPVVTLLISQYTGSPYPAEAIATFISGNDLTTPFPSLDMENVSYSFFSEEGEAGFLRMDPLGENTNANIMAKAKEALVKGGFKVCYMPMEEGEFMDLYIDPAVEYYVSFQEYEGSLYANISIDGGEMAAAVDLEYPTEKIAALTPEEIDDELPSFEVRGALYMIGEDGNGFQLQIHVQPDMNATSVLRQISSALTAAEYKPDNENGYLSPNESIAVYVNNVQDKIIEIQVGFIEEEPPVEPEDILYTFVCENDWTPGSIFDNDAVFYAYVWNDYGEEDWIPLEFVEGQTFTAEISNKWTYCIIVRLDPEKEVGWDAKWNQSDDLKLSGEESTINFSFTK